MEQFQVLVNQLRMTRHWKPLRKQCRSLF